MKYIISLGGSLIAPDNIDTAFLKKFRKVILSEAGKGNQFVIVPGGGATCRVYQKAAKKVSRISNDDLDWIGIATNLFHTQFLRRIFGQSKNIMIEKGGLKPGGTSDTTAVKFARKYKAKTIVNLTNVGGIYDRDPRKFKKAKLIRELSWTELKQKFGTKKTPGRNLPFDSAAADQASGLGLKVVIMNGRNLKNFQNFLAGKRFTGTVIR
jgi:uridylate kinase